MNRAGIGIGWGFDRFLLASGSCLEWRRKSGSVGGAGLVVIGLSVETDLQVKGQVGGAGLPNKPHAAELLIVH